MPTYISNCFLVKYAALKAAMHGTVWLTLNAGSVVSMNT